MENFRELAIAFNLRVGESIESSYGFTTAIKALRVQYKDVCCNGDIIINQFIDLFEKDDENVFESFILEIPQDVDYKMMLLEHIKETIAKWTSLLKSGNYVKPDPFWTV